MTVALSTERLHLRPPRPSDALAVSEGLGNPNVARWLNPIPLPYTQAMARGWIDALPDRPRPGDATFMIETPSGDVVGGVGHKFELGYWLAEAHWGLGYATEACRALLDWIFAGSDIERVTSAAHDDNLASLKVQHKLGFVETGAAPKFSQARQYFVPHILTELTRIAYLGRKPQ